MLGWHKRQYWMTLQLLDSHGQQLFNGDLEKMAKELSQQKEEKKKMKSVL